MFALPNRVGRVRVVIVFCSWEIISGKIGLLLRLDLFRFRSSSSKVSGPCHLMPKFEVCLSAIAYQTVSQPFSPFLQLFLSHQVCLSYSM